jgi:hypothetical protein
MKESAGFDWSTGCKNAGSMKTPRHSVYFLGLFFLAFSLDFAADPPSPDSRVLRVRAFFDSYNCPQPDYADEYVRFADRYGVDYRILPAISLLESTCGSFQRLNNHWGWNSARTGFSSVTHGIEYITAQLAHDPAYRGRDIDGKLLSYNPRTSYKRLAKRLMKAIEPIPE